MNQQQELIPVVPGEYLKQKRLEQNLSLAKVAEAICLDEQRLRDIEEDGANDIAPIYKNGYIKKYARYLGIPKDEVVALLSPTNASKSAVRNVFTEPPTRNPLDKWLHATSYVLASLLIGTLAWQFTHEAVRLSQNGSRLHNEQEPLVASDNQSFSGSVQAKEVTGTVNASIASLGALHDNNADGLDTAEQAWAAVSRTALEDGESRLSISVSADSWVEIIDVNGQELEMDLLRGGSDKAYHGKPPFRILLGRAAAVRLSMDGEPVDLTEYTRGDIAQLTWPQETMADNQEQSNN
jgi:cytoskeleton protein RodZ